jgi:hypothetical protein
MGKNIFIPQYFLTIALMILAGALFIAYLYIGQLNEALEVKFSELSMYSHYNFTALHENAVNMRDTVDALGITIINKDTAVVNLLNHADYLASRYNAVMDGDIIDTGQAFQINLSINNHRQDAVNFVNMLPDNKVVAQFTSFTISGDYMDAELILTQPYVKDGGL